MERIRWGVLGCADIVERRFVDAIGQVNNGEFYALATRGKSDRLARVLAACSIPNVYYDYDELLADPHIDAVYIPVPNSLHTEWTIRTATAKKHVLCEKPIACTVADVKRIQAAAKENNVVVMEAFACMHSPLYATILDLIDAGEIGELRMVDSAFCYFMTGRENNNIAKTELCGGSIYDVGCYNTLTIRRLTRREPVSVKAMANFWDTGLDADRHCPVRHGGRHTLQLQKAPLRLFPTGDYPFLARKATSISRARPIRGGSWISRSNNEIGSRIVSLDVRNTYALEMEQFGRCILNGEQPLLSLEDSMRNVRALQMLHNAIGSWMSEH